MDEAEASRRDTARQGVLKGAKLVTGNSVVDCLVLNISAGGARVQLSAMMVLPDRLTLCFRGGAAFACERRWARALEVGLEFIGPAGLTERTAAEAADILEGMDRLSLPAVLAALGSRRHFDNPHLALIAAEAEAAQARLRAALASQIGALRVPDLF